MSKNYDNWERLVTAVLRRQHDRELALSHSRDVSSIGSTSSSSQFDSDESVVHRQNYRSIPMDHSDLSFGHREWKAMLPPRKHEILYRSASLCFFLDPITRKTCFLIGATSLGFSEEIWKMETHPKSRFSDVVVPIDLQNLGIYGRTNMEALSLSDPVVPASLWNLGIYGRINMQALSPNTLYGAYVVFELANSRARSCCPVNSRIRVGYSEGDSYRMTNEFQFPLCEDRADGWKEIHLGTFYVTDDKEAEVEAQIVFMYSTCPLLKGLIVEGIEFRPSSEIRPQNLPKQERKWTCSHGDIDNEAHPEQEEIIWEWGNRDIDSDHENLQIGNWAAADDIDSWHFNKGR